MSVGSLAYRRHKAAIWNGIVPDKYQRLLPYIQGRSILEIGAAEGVLALLLADRDPKASITALELHPDRNAASLVLKARWRELGKDVRGCTFVCGDIRNHLYLLDGVDTFVAIRTIYHLGDFIRPLFQAVAQQVPKVVLAGNPNRARWPHSSESAADLGSWNRYAGVPGMREVLEDVGYTIDTVVEEGDPIVTGSR